MCWDHTEGIRNNLVEETPAQCTEVWEQANLECCFPQVSSGFGVAGAGILLCSLPLSWIPWVWDCSVSCFFWSSIPWLLQDQSLVLGLLNPSDTSISISWVWDCSVPYPSWIKSLGPFGSNSLGFGIAQSLTSSDLSSLAPSVSVLFLWDCGIPWSLLISVPWPLFYSILCLWDSSILSSFQRKVFSLWGCSVPWPLMNSVSWPLQSQGFFFGTGESF